MLDIRGGVIDMKKTSKELEYDIIKEYDSGKSCREVGRIFDISESTVFNILVRNGVTRRSKGGLYPLPEQKIIQLYKEGFSATQIAKKYGTTWNTILTCLKRNNIQIDNKYHNLTLKHDYFERIDSYDKAYFIGFLLADGSVSGSTNAISLCLKAEDCYILETFSNKIKNSNKIYFSPRNEASLTFKSSKIKHDLIKYNIYPNKTYTTTLPIMPEKFMPHLIRGLIDGDGWISAKSHQIGFCGSEQLVTQVRDYLVEKLGVYQVKILKTGSHLWQITWASKKDILLIGDYIYKNKRDCYLKRKYENFMEIPR